MKKYIVSVEFSGVVDVVIEAEDEIAAEDMVDTWGLNEIMDCCDGSIESDVIHVEPVYNDLTTPLFEEHVHPNL